MRSEASLVEMGIRKGSRLYVKADRRNLARLPFPNRPCRADLPSSPAIRLTLRLRRRRLCQDCSGYFDDRLKISKENLSSRRRRGCLEECCQTPHSLRVRVNTKSIEQSKVGAGTRTHAGGRSVF